MDSKEKIPFDLLAKHFSGRESSAEKRLLEAWKRASQKNEREYALAEKIYTSNMESEFEPNTEQALRKVLDKLPKQKRGFLKSKVLWIGTAAALILGMGVAYVGYRYYKSDANELLSYHNEKYDRVVVTLPDDSNIWLRKGSILYFPKKFRGRKRSVKFSGQGYFEITSNPDRPFIIEAENTVTTVLGTKFSLNTRAADSSVVLILDEGLVAFETQSSEKIEIEAGEKLKFDRKIKYIEISKNNEQNHSAWKSHLLSFRNQTVQNIVGDMEDYYEIRFGEIPENIAIEKHSFTLDSIQSADEAIEILTLVLELNIVKEGDFYYIEDDS